MATPHLYEALGKYLKVQQKLGISPPVVLMLSLLGIAGYYMEIGRPGLYQGNKIIHEDTLLLPEELIDDLSKSDEEIMKPLFDRIWNAAGWEGSMSYDANGKRRTQ